MPLFVPTGPPENFGISVYIRPEGSKIGIEDLFNDRLGYGLSTTLGMVYAVGPDIIPVGADLTETLEWRDHTGAILGTTNILSYAATSSGPKSVQVTVTLSDAALSFVYSFSQDYSFTVDSLYPNDVIFEMPFLSEHGILRYVNMDISRTLSYFPKWSSAYKSTHSNTSKFLSPIFERVSFHTNDLDNIKANNHTLHRSASYEYPNKIRKLLAIRRPDFIETEYGHCKNLGSNSTMSLQSVQVAAVSRKPSVAILPVSNVMYAGENPMRLVVPSSIFIHSPNASLRDPHIVSVTGVTRSGKRITEKLNIESSVPLESINEFHLVLSVSGNPYPVTISNVLATHHSHTDQTLLPKRITDENGRYFTPEFSYEDDSLAVMNADLLSKNEEYRFSLPFTPDSMLVSNLLDVFLIKDNALYSAKLFLDYIDLKQVDSSTNNNDMLSVCDENARVGSVASVTVNTALLKAENPGGSFKLSVSNLGSDLYLKADKTLSSDKNSWVALSQAGDRVSMSFTVANDSPYIFELTIGTRSFSAMVYQNKLDFILIEEDVAEIFVHNKTLYGIDTVGSTDELSLIRLGFTTEDSYCQLAYPFETMRTIYDTRNL